LATDGLVAERTGITIDVAHIYFSTARKKSYIIADTPGHVNITVTGTSTSQYRYLIDARKGVEQTYRHFLSIIYE
jgi:sulfate adenylyltransferase subunit 1